MLGWREKKIVFETCKRIGDRNCREEGGGRNGLKKVLVHVCTTRSGVREKRRVKPCSVSAHAHGSKGATHVLL